MERCKLCIRHSFSILFFYMITKALCDVLHGKQCHAHEDL